MAQMGLRVRTRTSLCLGSRGCLLQHDLVADALDDWLDGVAQGLERLAGEAAGAGLGARKGAAVEQQNALAGLGEIVGCGAACGAGTGDEDVVVVGHVQVSVYACKATGSSTDVSRPTASASRE